MMMLHTNLSLEQEPVALEGDRSPLQSLHPLAFSFVFVLVAVPLDLPAHQELNGYLHIFDEKIELNRAL
jgi:hypothetical protein